MRKFAAFLNHYNFNKILDVGTGNGNFIKMIASMTDGFEEIIGIDEIEVAVSTSQKNFEDERISFQLMSGYKMEFENDAFDLVCLSNTLHHLHDVRNLMKEMERVLKPGGVILINEMIANGLDKRQKSHLKIHHFAASIDRACGDIHDETMNAVDILKTLENSSELTIKDAWNLKFERATKNTQEEIDWLMSTIERVLVKVKDHKEYDSFVKQGDKVKKYIKKNGFDSATQLMVVLT